MPLLDIQVVESLSATAHGPGADDGNVDGFFANGRRRRFDRRRISDIELLNGNVVRAASGFFELLGGFGIARTGDHVVAATGILFGELEADAAAGAYDEYCGHVSLPSFCSALVAVRMSRWDIRVLHLVRCSSRYVCRRASSRRSDAA